MAAARGGGRPPRKGGRPTEQTRGALGWPPSPAPLTSLLTPSLLSPRALPTCRAARYWPRAQLPSRARPCLVAARLPVMPLRLCPPPSPCSC
eukprot:360210-Chlamydomonas_euryale.AAC.17